MPEDLYKELKAKYESSLEEDFKVALKNKKTITYAFGIFFGAILLTMLCGFLGIFAGFPIIAVVGPFLCIGAFIVMIVFIIKGSKGGDPYHVKYYQTVIKDLMNSIYSNVELSLADDYDFRNVFHTSGFYRGYDRKHIKSEWKMRYGGHDLTIYDIVLEEEHTDSDGDTTYTTVFAGLFGVMSLEHALNDDIYINKSGGIANRGTEKVNMDSVVFNKEYRVYATNKVKAMQLLTHDVMDKILEYSEKYKTKFEFRILNDKLYFRIFNYNTFSNESNETISRSELENDYHNLILFKDITDLVENSAKENGLFD